MVRAKFVCESVAKTRYGHHTVRLTPVTGDSEENKKFWKWTPTGSIEFGTINDEAVKQFEPGKEYYVDFTPAE